MSDPSPVLQVTEEFSRALDLFEGGSNLFLTGRAGTGKSTLVRRFVESTDRRVVVAAPTGIAALNVGGYTLHRLFGFRPDTSLADVRSGRYYPGRFAATIAGLQTLVIDEASMVRADLFDKVAAALERFGPQRGEELGGVQVALVGDLFQLPPVVSTAEAGHLASAYPTPYFFSARAYRPEIFPTVSLTTVFRQQGDDRLTSALNAIREGTLLSSARYELDERVDVDFEPPAAEMWLTVAPTNRVVTARNNARLEAIDEPEIVQHAWASGDLDGFDPPVPDVLRFKVGAQVMLLNNDPSDRWANGTLGTIVGFDPHDQAATVRLQNGRVVAVGHHTWDVTRPVVAGGSMRHEIVGTYTQLPFTLAWAITIHKSQGQTIDRLVVDLRGGTFDYGQLYVALSRCTSLEGLVLRRPVLPKDMKVDRRVVRFLQGSAGSGAKHRRCAIGVLTVGEEGQRSRPRPVELAVAFEDGTAISTLVNPQRDLADARSAYGIGVDDVLLAPTLAQAWAVIAPMLAGCTPVGPDVDELLGLLDFELKRLGHVIVLPLGVPTRGRAGGRKALERARAALAAAEGIDGGGAATAFALTDELPDAGCLVSRDAGVEAPALVEMPMLSAYLELSRQLGPLLRGEAEQVELIAGPEAGPAREVIATQLREAAAATPLTAEVVRRLQAVEKSLGLSVLSEELLAESAVPDIASVLVTGTRVCFTGMIQLPDGRLLDRDDAHDLALRAGLVPVANVSKTRCDVLVVAEAGTQSGKARKALELEKPVYTAEEFLAWFRETTGVSASTPSAVPPAPPRARW
ncbi:AAA family ATPase [Pseudactinotalea terrae]|uniref:AAA family ATPase n=1 Tax=Pseudactinotalea terrae TaxID=1743262 RepID=UPI001F4FD16E|nr:AAA family ATPase [Pseudactinotalea terrae]